MAQGVEIRLYDPSRTPPDWTDVMAPGQCAVLFTRRESSLPLSPAGQPFARRDEATCLLFDRLAAAQQYCEAKVLEIPYVVCEILDCDGRAQPPLMVILHPDHRDSDDSSAAWTRRRKLIAVALLLAAGPLIWLDFHHRNTLILPTFVGFNCILLAMRLFYWHFGLRHRESERLKRVAAHQAHEAASSEPLAAAASQKG